MNKKLHKKSMSMKRV